MKVCAISFKECWQEDDGQWYSYGGFPLQMSAIASLFDQMTLMVTRGKRRPGGLPLPPSAKVIPMPLPRGTGARRKLSVFARSPYYVGTMARQIRSADAVHVPVPGDLALLGMLTTLAMRKPLLARYGGSWHAADGATTRTNQFTKACMRRFAGGRNVMLATGDGQQPPASGMHWIFSTALSDAQLKSIDVSLDRGLNRPPRLVYIGRLSREKGVIHLLQALGMLRQQGFQPLPTLTIIGDGPQRRELEDFTRQNQLGDLVSFVGQIPHGELTSHLAGADICVQPSLTEGFSKAWLDAMAHGLPVIASEVGAAADVIGHDGRRGWLLPPGDSHALAATLQRVCSEHIHWAEKRRACRQFVASRTLGAWADTIGRICADQWHVSFENGRLIRQHDREPRGAAAVSRQARNLI